MKFFTGGIDRFSGRFAVCMKSTENGSIPVVVSDVSEFTRNDLVYGHIYCLADGEQEAALFATTECRIKEPVDRAVLSSGQLSGITNQVGAYVNA